MPANNTEIEKRLWDANDDFDFAEWLEELNEELETLNAAARGLQARIAEIVERLPEKP